MTDPAPRLITTPRDRDLGLHRITNRAGLSISALPNGCVFSIEHQHEHGRTLINQVLGSPLQGGIARLYVRIRTPEPRVAEAVGPGARVVFGIGDDRFLWEGETGGVRHRVVLWLHPRELVWLWRLEVVNAGEDETTCDAILVQDVGLGARGYVTNNEAYTSQYIDHHIARHPDLGPVVMSRQNLAQDGRHPWLAHGCVDGAESFATDAMQLFGPAYRDSDAIPSGDLPGERLQHEVACAMLQSRRITLEPNDEATWSLFGLYEPDHPQASSDADLITVERARRALHDFTPRDLSATAPVRSVLQDAAPALADPLDAALIDQRYRERLHEEFRDGRLLSFFVPDGAANRHVVLREKERIVTRRHGALVRSGQGMLPDEVTLCATCWMHGVFGAQLTIGNTSFHKLFSVPRDPYNMTRASGLRMLVDLGTGWQLLTVPSAFEIGLSDCRWIYRFGARTITVHAVASGEEPAMQWQVAVAGAPCCFLILAHVMLGQRELDHPGRIEIDATKKRVAFRPARDSIWGRHYPDAVYGLVTSTPDAIEALGGDELLHVDGKARGGAYAALRTRPTTEFGFTVVGSMKDPEDALRLAARYERGVDADAMLAPAMGSWQRVTRSLRLRGQGADLAALDTSLPWLAHDAIVHLTVPHGLEQRAGAAWGTRDVCQGPVEFLLSLEHDEPVREILEIVFAEQSESQGDWPQWFMLAPYSSIRDRHSHGDVIVWPLKALCDYIEATGDLDFLDHPVAWRCDDLQRSARQDTMAAHVDKLLATVRQRCIPGTHLIRYGEGDWNDSLQPADPKMRDWMVSSWTVALLFEQVGRYAEVLQRAGRKGEAQGLCDFAAAMREDVNRHLICAGTIAGYALFEPDGGEPELLLHPSDERTGLSYSLLPMTRGIIGGLFTPEQAQHHLQLIREHLLFPDGVRLMDRPVVYQGGPERIFRRAESSSSFGREIGLMYVHAHLRYGEAMAVLGDADALWSALLVANPIAVTEHVAQASLRQRNTYFSSSDAAFRDRYQASAEWERVKGGTIALDGGWRVYSSGPGIYTRLLLQRALGIRRNDGKREVLPLLPCSLGPVKLEWDLDGRRVTRDVS